MVDEVLPLLHQERRLRVLFLDLNSYFASVEQQERPELRDRPIAVVPVMADTSFVIASSYPAKRMGVKCGTMIRDARRMCPGIEIIKARPPVYVSYHKAILEAAERVLPIEEVCSIDEMRFRLLGTESTPKVACELAREMKRRIHEEVGECLTSSIGIAPNAFLAKVATDMQKPDGLVVLEQGDLPHRLHGLKLTDFAGINRRMAARLNAAGIFTAEQLCAASRGELLHAFGSVVGEKWWYLLRGFDLGPEVHARKTMGHSHVLPPELRNDKGSKEVLLRLLAKAAARLRATDLWTAAMAVSVRGYRRSWQAHTKLPPTQDSITLTEALLELWQSRDFDEPRMVGVTFYDLRTHEEFTPSLFDPTVDRSKLSHAVDHVNQKFGKNKVFLANIDRVRHTAEEKIAFNKTWLFSEGKGDNEWVNHFKAPT
ncbi:MAG: Y-family DNA polymerase [Fimbriimonas sp.]